MAAEARRVEEIRQYVQRKAAPWTEQQMLETLLAHLDDLTTLNAEARSACGEALLDVIDRTTRLHEAERERDMWKVSSEEHAKDTDAQYALRKQAEQRVAEMERLIRRAKESLDAALSPAPKEEP